MSNGQCWNTPEDQTDLNLQSLLHEDAHIDGLLLPRNLNMLLEDMDVDYDDEEE